MSSNKILMKSTTYRQPQTLAKRLCDTVKIGSLGSQYYKGLIAVRGLD
jgi:hypothetical protein